MSSAEKLLPTKERLQRDPPGRWLAARAGSKPLLIPLAQSAEILPYTPPTPMPRTQPWVLGVSSLQGRLSTVIDLPRFLGATQDGAPSVITASSRLLQLPDRLGLRVMLLLDQVIGLRGAELFTLDQDVPDRNTADLGIVLRDQEGVLWQEFNLCAFSQKPELLDITQ